MTGRARFDPLRRRDVLRIGALAAAAVPLAAACGPGYATATDPLLPLLHAAQADAQAAAALAGSGAAGKLAGELSRVRRAHADALRAEIDRLNRPKPETTTPAPVPVKQLSAFAQELETAIDTARAPIPSTTRYRASLLGSIAAGCAALQQLAPELGAGPLPPVKPVPTGPLDDALEVLQQALAAENAAIWTYGLVTAFLPGAYTAAITEAIEAHRDRRDTTRKVLRDAGATPRPAAPAYVPAQPVTDDASAVRVVVMAESDATAAWHGVLARTDDAGLRTMAADALMASAGRGTRWRDEADMRPATIALPGIQATS